MDAGVTRDTYSMFWLQEEWKAVGKILVKGDIDTRYFPVILTKTFILYILFEEVETKYLVTSPLLCLANYEAIMFKELLNEETVVENYSSAEFFKFLNQLVQS